MKTQEDSKDSKQEDSKDSKDSKDSTQEDSKDSTQESDAVRKQDKIEDDFGEAARAMHLKPRWTFAGVIGLMAVLLSVISERLTIGPAWLVPSIAVALIIPLFITTFTGNYHITRPIAMGIILLITLAVVVSVVLLIRALFGHEAKASDLFRDALLLWVGNVLIFALSYWELDQGGPVPRNSHHPGPPDFLFPQMAVDVPAWKGWKPRFPDYLFLAFNTSTAFSPTDTTIMSWQAKVLMMLQSSISLIIVAVLAARAINIA